MTKREKFIVMAYTGIAMLPFDDFHEQVEKLMGRPVYSHEFALDLFINELKEKIKPDFLELCSQNTSMKAFDAEDTNTWPEDNYTDALVWTAKGYFAIWEFYVSQGMPFWTDGDTIISSHYIKAWMPLPEPYKEENT